MAYYTNYYLEFMLCIRNGMAWRAILDKESFMDTCLGQERLRGNATFCRIHLICLRGLRDDEGGLLRY